MQFRRGFKAEAERIALKVRRTLGLSALDRFDPEAACVAYDITLFKMTELGAECSAFTGIRSGSFSAVTVPLGFQTAVVHNDCHHEYRQRSNICHELAHLFLGHKAYPPLTRNGERMYNQGIEAEADFLAGALLIPKDLALHILEEGIVSRAQRLYGVSKPMLGWRLRISGAEKIVEYRRRKSGAR